jgi:hypothetical protein
MNGFMQEWSRHENAPRTTCSECHFESSKGYRPSHTAACSQRPRYSWTQAICEMCWTMKEPGRVPIKLRIPDAEKCAYCGEDTDAGIYVRDDPMNVQFPREKD